MHRPIRHDASDGVECGVYSEATIVVHAQITILFGRIAPGDHEHRVALFDEVTDQRVVRRQIEDVILHDPGRYDQHGLGVYLGRRRRILDQFDQVIAIDDFTRRHRNRLAGLELIGT